jgi:hypothetical protein
MVTAVSCVNELLAWQTSNTDESQLLLLELEVLLLLLLLLLVCSTTQAAVKLCACASVFGTSSGRPSVRADFSCFNSKHSETRVRQSMRV